MVEEIPKEIVSENKSYKVIKKLGEGGTSIVYLVEDGKQRLALKILGEEVDKAFKDRYIEILKNEFEVLSKLRHPNIARVYDFGYSPKLGKYFFTTEYVEGTSIQGFTENANLKTKEELFVQFLTALDYVHKNGLIHSDIKTGNILVTMVKGAPVIKLVDFGFATKHLATSQYVVGTLHYLAPELFLRMAEIDARIDIYASGVVLYKLLHRKYPCPYNTMEGIISWHKKRGEFSYAGDIPDYLKQLISKMTAVYPSNRFSTPSQAIDFINDRTEGRYNKIISKIAGLIPGEGTLVGRDNIITEFNAIINLLKLKESPEKIGVLFTGQPGIGKSRMVKEIKYRSELAELPVRELLCDPSKDLVSEFISQFTDVSNITLESLDISKPDPSRKFKIIQWTGDLINSYSKKGLVILVDDFDLANHPFVELMTELENRMHVNREEGNKIPIFLVATSKSEKDLPDFIQKWKQKTCISETPLQPLTENDIETYMTSVGVKDFEKHRKAIAEFSSGIPQLVEAYCQHILSPEGMARPPANLAESYLGRTNSLSVKAKPVLKLLSVIHFNPTIDDITEITGNKKDFIADAIQELAQHNMARRTFPSMHIAMENRAMAQVIKENLKKDELKTLSLQIGEWLEEREPGSYVELANYFIEAEKADKAKEYSLKAAEQLESKYNCTEAIRFYEIAKHYSSSDQENLELSRKQAKLNIIIGRFAEAEKVLESFDKQSIAILDDYLGLGAANVKTHNLEKAKMWYEKGLEKITDETAVTDIVQFKNNLGNVYLYMRDFEKSEKYFTEAIADATVCLLLDNNLGLILSAKGKYCEAINFYDARMKYLEAKNNKRALGLCYAERGYIHMTNDHPEEAIADFEKSYDLSSQIDDWHNILVVLGNLVRVYQQLSHYTKALDAAQKSLKMKGKLGSLEDIAQTHLTVGILYESLGVFDLARQHIDMATDRFTATNNKAMIGWCYLTLAYLNKDIDKLDESISSLDALNTIVDEIKSEDLKSWSKLTRADIHFEKKEYKKAEEILKDLNAELGMEFSVRTKLIRLKLDATKNKKINEQGFNNLLDDCEKTKSLELQWEIYSAMGEAFEISNDKEKSIACFAKAYEIIGSIANNLSEAYSESYKQQRFRAKVINKIAPSSPELDANGEPSGNSSVEDEKTADFSKIFKKS